MDFDPPESVKPLLAQIEQFVERVVIPAEQDVLERGFAQSAAQLTELRQQCKQAGLWGPQLPKALGGLGLGLVEHGLVSERLDRIACADEDDDQRLEEFHWQVPVDVVAVQLPDAQSKL